MVAAIARETGTAGLIMGGICSVVVTGLVCPPALIGLAASGALWLYGNSRR
jgi:hypothetical protein